MPAVRVSWFKGKDTPTKQAVAASVTESIVRTGTDPKYLRHFRRRGSLGLGRGAIGD